MPIFEYICRDCGKEFETVVLGSQRAECPSCHGQKLDQQLSSFAVSVGGSSPSRTAPCGAPASACGTGGGGGT